MAHTDEAFAIYLFVKRLTFYLQDTECTIMCDDKTLKSSQGRNKKNKVNNWSIELSSCKLNTKHMEGIMNVLADYLSRLISAEMTMTMYLKGH